MSRFGLGLPPSTGGAGADLDAGNAERACRRGRSFPGVMNAVKQVLLALDKGSVLLVLDVNAECFWASQYLVTQALPRFAEPRRCESILHLTRVEAGCDGRYETR